MWAALTGGDRCHIYRVLFGSGFDEVTILDWLNDKRGWRGFHPRIWFVHTRSSHADVVVEMTTNEEIVERYGKKFHGFSVTDSRRTPVVVSINSKNWNRPPPEFKGSRQVYRCYLIQHEFGHVLGYDHAPFENGKVCPVMYQQTRGTENCEANPWPSQPK